MTKIEINHFCADPQKLSQHQRAKKFMDGREIEIDRHDEEGVVARTTDSTTVVGTDKSEAFISTVAPFFAVKQVLWCFGF